MNHLLIIAHQPLASALRACVLHVYPEYAHSVHAYDVPADEAPAHSMAQASRLLPAQPCLICTDVFGATPFHVAKAVAEASGSRLLTGANLPMLVRAMCYCHEPLPQMLQRALDGAHQGVMQIGSSAQQDQQARTETAAHAAAMQQQ